MKKISLFILLMIICFTACSFDTDFPQIEMVVSNTAMQNRTLLEGEKRSKLIKNWGEPTLSCENYDCWIEPEKEIRIFVLYENNKAVKVLLSSTDTPIGLTEKITGHRTQTIPNYEITFNCGERVISGPGYVQSGLQTHTEQIVHLINISNKTEINKDFSLNNLRFIYLEHSAGEIMVGYDGNIIVLDGKRYQTDIDFENCLLDIFDVSQEERKVENHINKISEQHKSKCNICK